MIKSVLCAIDLAHTETHKQVLGIAKQQADLAGASLDVITVVPNYGMSIVGDHFDQGFHDETVKKAGVILKAAVAKALGKAASAKIRHVVTSGNTYEEILGAAKKIDCDLIVIGAHRPNYSDYLLGPNAARVVRHSTCSVYVVRSE